MSNPKFELYPWQAIWAEELVKRLKTNPQQSIEAQGILLNLMESIDMGNSCIDINPDDCLELENLVSTDDSVAPFFFDGSNLLMRRHHILESRLAEEVGRLSGFENDILDLRPYESLLEDVHQKQAMDIVAKNNIAIITGGPGTGKTYTLARIITAINQVCPDSRIAMSAPTGKASQRMQEALQAAFSDPSLVQAGYINQKLQELKPVTIHRLLGMGFSNRPQFDSENRLPFDIIVVDEVSMLDLSLATALFSAIQTGAKLILLGDSNQLASVDVGCVLYDLQKSDLLSGSHVDLKVSRRFSDTAMIGRFARFIQANTLTASNSVISSFSKNVVQPSTLNAVDLDSVVVDLVQAEFINPRMSSSHYLNLLWQGFDSYLESINAYLIDGDSTSIHYVKLITKAFDDYRILTATRSGDLGLIKINQFMQSKMLNSVGLKDGTEWYVGRPVMITENNYKLGLANGDIGITLFHRTHPGELEVFFPSSEKWVNANLLPTTIQTAYALTIHKSQGSEFMHVAVVLDESSDRLLSKELIYTAVTRAKKAVSLLADQNSLVKALTIKSTRKSGLQMKLKKI